MQTGLKGKHLLCEQDWTNEELETLFAVASELKMRYALDLDTEWLKNKSLFMLFFVLSGAELNLTVLPSLGLIGVVYILTRVAGKYFGAYIGCTISKSSPTIRKYLGLSLIPQAGVAIGISQLVVKELPQYGASIQAVILCATLIYELVGPVITKYSLIKAGEIEVEPKKVKIAPPAAS